MATFLVIVAWAFLVAFIKVIGYSVVAEKVHLLFQKVFGRSAYAAYIRDWQSLRKNKQELSSISAQDEFAKWARLSRGIDKQQAEFDKLHSSRKRTAVTIEFALSIIIRVGLYINLFWFGIWKGRMQPVEDIDVPSDIFGPLQGYLCMPYLEAGQISVSVALILGVTSCKYVLETAFQSVA